MVPAPKGPTKAKGLAMTDRKDRPGAPESKGGGRRPPGAATRWFAGYRLDELTEALARYEEAFELYERVLAKAFNTWETGHRMDAARTALAAAISLSRCLGTPHTRPLT